MNIPSAEEEMIAAIRHAQLTLGDFFAAYERPRDGQNSFLLKVAFEEGESIEHIWLADVQFSSSGSRGVVANEPSMSSLRYKQVVEFDPMRITDWMYVEDGRLVGGFTTRLLRDRMTPAERARMDTELPYRI
jgi:uncharacterized protein YegJ (DUF2314 family)